MAYTNIKTEIDGKIYTNILREITGDILNEVLKKMVDSLGKGYRYMGILEPDGSRPSGDENMFMVATEAGYYTALADDIPSGITICSFSEGSIRVETILNLDEIFSGNHSWGGNNTFNGFTQFQNEVDVSFENVYDLEDGETLSNKLASLVTAIATKISKVTGAVEDNLATFDENGNVKDSGVSLADIDEKIDECAKADGISEKLVSGSARGILSPSAIEELFLFQRTANGAGGTGAAVFQSIKGNSIVWNQLLPDLAEPIAFPASTTTTPLATLTLIKGHKYMFMAELNTSVTQNSNDRFTLSFNGEYPITTGLNLNNERVCRRIFTYSDATATASMILWITNYSSQVSTDVKVLSVNLIDLTASTMSVTSVSDFTKFYNLPYYAPNPGAILNNCATGMVTDGFNQWDEETELGAISFDNGRNVPGTTTIRSKNYIRVTPGASYYFKTSDYMWATGYDADKNYIGGLNSNSSFGNVALTIPANVYYIRFWCRTNYGTTYKNDICINLSGSRNGEYEPHWSDTTDLPITTATGKLNGEGESVVISPNGLAGVGASFDEAIVEKGMWTKDIIRRARVDMGALNWAYSSSGFFYTEISTMAYSSTIISTKYVAGDTSSVDKTMSVHPNGILRVKDSAYATAADFKAAMSGVMLEYELATPKEYILDTPVPVVAGVDENGTQTILPQGVDEQGTPMTAPFKASIQYPVKLGIAPIGQQSLVNLLEKMKSAGKIASYTMFWDATTGVFDFTIS